MSRMAPAILFSTSFVWSRVAFGTFALITRNTAPSFTLSEGEMGNVIFPPWSAL